MKFLSIDLLFREIQEKSVTIKSSSIKNSNYNGSQLLSELASLHFVNMQECTYNID